MHSYLILDNHATVCILSAYYSSNWFSQTVLNNREDILVSTWNNGRYSAEVASRTVRKERLQWRHNESYGVFNNRRLDCLLNRLFRRRSKKTSKLRVTGLCVGSLFYLYFKYIYTGWTIQLHCSSMVPCYKVKYMNIKNTYIHIHKYKSYIKASISW